MMIYIFGDLRQLRSFELVRPPISPPQRLRPLRNNTTSVPPPPDPELWLVPIARPPILPKPVHDPEKRSFSLRPLPPIPEPVSPCFSSNNGLQPDPVNPRITLSSVCSGSFTSCDCDASRNSTLSFEETEIYISEVFYDIEPPYFRDDQMCSSPVPSSWKGESRSNTPSPSTTPRASRRFSSSADNTFRVSNAQTSTTSDSEREKWVPTAPFIKPFEYNEREEWEGENAMHTAEGSLGGYGAGDEESRIGHFVRPTSLRPGGKRVTGTRVSSQFRAGSRRGTIASSERLGTFDFDVLPAFRAPPSPLVAPALQRRPRYRTRDASPLPPPHDETGLIEAGRQESLLKTWLVELPKLFIRRMQGKCGAARQVIKDVLSRSAREGSRRNGDQDGSEYHDALETGDGTPGLPINSPTITSIPQPSGVREKEKVEENWRIRWKRALTVPAFRSPLTKILSPVVTRAQWEAVIRSGLLAFVVSFVVVAVLVAVPVP
jgi:hypothetical protein